MDLLKNATLILAAGVEGAGAFVIGLAAIEAFLRALWLFVPGRHAIGEPDPREAVRLKLGRWLAVALELELGADILRTAVAPTWNEIGQLAAIVVLRTALNFFLQREPTRPPNVARCAPHRRSWTRRRAELLDGEPLDAFRHRLGSAGMARHLCPIGSHRSRCETATGEDGRVRRVRRIVSAEPHRSRQDCGSVETGCRTVPTH